LSIAAGARIGYALDIRLQGLRQRFFRWLRSRRWRGLPRLSKLPRWWRWALLPLVPILLINLAVAWVGSCAVFPLSPFFLGYKLHALGSYAWHRPRCALVGDQPLAPPMLARAEQQHHLPCGLLGAIVQVESGGRPHRISSAGAMGPMQLIPPTARALGVSDPFDPEESVDGAARYLHLQLASFHSIRLAAAAYNAGPGAIVGHHVPQNGQTEIYVDRVMAALVTERHARCAPPPRRPTAAPAGERSSPSSHTPARGVAAPRLIARNKRSPL
jgi:hypothetical protein